MHNGGDPIAFSLGNDKKLLNQIEWLIGNLGQTVYPKWFPNSFQLCGKMFIKLPTIECIES